MTIRLFLSFCFLLFCNQLLLGQNTKTSIENKSYLPYVGTVQLYPVSTGSTQEMNAPIVSIDKSENLLLQFDLLQEEYTDLQAKIIHCNADWTPSLYSDIEFLDTYNIFDIRDFEYSINTTTLYVNYWMSIPQMKKSGNYIVKVYQNEDEEAVVLTRRFIIYEPLVSVKVNTRISDRISVRKFNQQIEFSVFYSSLYSSNPIMEFGIVVRQNQRWDTAIKNLNPTRVEMNGSQLDYHHFGMENNFKGGNEFRMADLSSYNYRGLYIAAVDPEANPRSATLQPVKSRQFEVYSNIKDQNGGFSLSSTEITNDYLEYDYLATTFLLKSNQLPLSVYVLGAFNDWIQSEQNRMKYNPTMQQYENTLLLKQGKYDYTYWLPDESENPYVLEGSHYQTKNEYDIIVYFRAFGDITDRVVGYRAFRSDL